MKYLSQFQEFRINDFLRGKTLVVVGVSDYTDYNSKELIGRKVETVITRDETPYAKKDGVKGSNLYERIVLKCTKKDLDVEIGSAVMPKSAKAVVFGEYRNQLAVTCEDVVVIKAE